MKYVSFSSPSHQHSQVSSFWSMSLSWQVLFCSMTSTFTTDLFNSAFTGFSYTGDFGQFKTDKYILFQIDSQIDLNILGIIPSVILGILGGLLGSLFIFINLKFARLRSRRMVICNIWSLTRWIFKDIPEFLTDFSQ